MECWYPRSISCPEQTADKHRTPAARALHGTQEDQKCISSSTPLKVSHPSLCCPGTHVGTVRTVSPRTISDGMPSPGPAGDRQQPTVCSTSPSYPSTCWRQAASLQGGGLLSPIQPRTDGWGNTQRRQPVCPAKLSQDGEDKDLPLHMLPQDGEDIILRGQRLPHSPGYPRMERRTGPSLPGLS